MRANDIDFNRTRCRECKGSGMDVFLSLKLGEETQDGYLPVLCAKCHGTGWIAKTDGPPFSATIKQRLIRFGPLWQERARGT